MARLRRALLDHCVLVFRDQAISEEDQVRFTGYFGRPVEHVRRQPDRPVKEIFLISNIEESGQPIGALGHGELSFHSDLSYLRRPGTLSLLYAVEVPGSGGSTQWCNGYAAYEALDDHLKTRVHGLRAIHRHPVEGQNPPEPVDHPVVRTHPETGRRTLYVGPHLTRSIVGMEPAREPRPARPTVRAHDPTALRVDPPLARRRPGHVGQPRHHAPTRALPRRPAPADEAHPGPGRGSPLLTHLRTAFQGASLIPLDGCSARSTRSSSTIQLTPFT